MTNLRGKHKQIYNLAAKEVDPQVNWAALVEEKLVRPRRRLGRGSRVGAGKPHHLMSPQCFLMFVSIEEQGSERRSTSPRVTQ